MDKDSEYTINRREFTRRMILAGIAAQIPWFIACSEEHEERENLKLDYRQTVLDILLPYDSDGPGAIDVLADKYLDWVFADPHYDQNTIQFMQKGFDRFKESCQQLMDAEFMSLSRTDQEFFVSQMSEKGWSKSWLSRLLSYSFEALLCHPAYNVNHEQIGWKWLDHTPGRPGPLPELMYPQILKTIREK